MSYDLYMGIVDCGMGYYSLFPTRYVSTILKSYILFRMILGKMKCGYGITQIQMNKQEFSSLFQTIVFEHFIRILWFVLCIVVDGCMLYVSML